MAGHTTDFERAEMDRSVSQDTDDVEVLKTQIVDDLKAEINDYEAVVDEARDASQLEQRMTLREGIKLYPAAIGWSVLLSTAIVMEGYGEPLHYRRTVGLTKDSSLISTLAPSDTALLGSFYAYPQFKQKYGTLLADGT